MFRTLALCLAVPTLALAASQVDILRQELRELDIAHPEADAIRDIAANTPRCFSVNGYGRYFPGIAGNEGEAYCTGIERNLQGTSDGIESNEHLQLVNEATAYAAAYNRYVLSHRK